MFEANNKDTRMTPWHRSGVFIVNFEHISYLVLVFLLSTLSGNCQLGNITNPFLYNVPFLYSLKMSERTDLLKNC